MYDTYKTKRRRCIMKPTKKAAEMTAKELARYIDQSVLKPEFTQEEIKKYTQEGINFGCATICINPASLELVSKMVEGTASVSSVTSPSGSPRQNPRQSRRRSTAASTRLWISTLWRTMVSSAAATSTM